MWLFACSALPYLPTSMRRVNLMFSRLPAQIAGKRFVDLGSGDGVTVIAAAHRGMEGFGVEVRLRGTVLPSVHHY